MFGERGELIEGVIGIDDGGRRVGLKGHHGLPHGFINEVTAFGDLAVSHLGPIVVDDGAGIGASADLQLRLLWFRKSVGGAIEIAKSVGLEVDVGLGLAIGGPYGVEHEPQDDGIGGADDSELPADEIVVDAASFARPQAIEENHEEECGAESDDENESVLCKRQHREKVLTSILLEVRVSTA